MDYQDIITVEPGKRSRKPYIRGMRITVYDVLSYLASGMIYEKILEDFPYLSDHTKLIAQLGEGTGNGERGTDKRCSHSNF